MQGFSLSIMRCIVYDATVMQKGTQMTQMDILRFTSGVFGVGRILCTLLSNWRGIEMEPFLLVEIVKSTRIGTWL
jgi:hypothetical protein